MDAWHAQLMLERQKQLEDALRRAEDQKATEEDWGIIYYECGLRRYDGTHNKRT